MLIILIVSAGLLFITFYPGAMSIDSYEQLRQARSGQFGDWHPPFMAWVWRAFDAILQGSILMLLAQLGLYLFSLWAIARVALPGPDSVRLGL
ncbi:MAG: hypothetical protein IPG06_23960 [Haliea sp.]|nr:hypothetical protein [Haliea sp.]